MELLAEIYDEDINEKANKVEKYRLRKAARAIILDKDKIALMKVSKRGYHKLPGGGIDENEKILEALEREIMEETGCIAEVQKELGIIIEHRTRLELLHINYCYIANLVNKNTSPNLTEEEKEEGFELIWVTLQEAINILHKDSPKEYTEKFIVHRDKIFLEKAKAVLKS
jgi:ADP-ribose pyrophosphatase YjhB (NUDIX family)